MPILRPFGHRIAVAMLGFSAALPAAALQGAPQGPPPGAACVDCGVVRSVRYVEEKGPSSGVGLVAGGVVGGVVGHQFGSGRGNTAATILGAGAGAYAGNEIERNRNRRAYWAVQVEMDNGTVRNLSYSQRPPANEGERIQLLDGGRRMALIAN